jgi:hypothetical protein
VTVFLAAQAVPLRRRPAGPILRQRLARAVSRYPRAAPVAACPVWLLLSPTPVRPGGGIARRKTRVPMTRRDRHTGWSPSSGGHQRSHAETEPLHERAILIRSFRISMARSGYGEQTISMLSYSFRTSSSGNIHMGNLKNIYEQERLSAEEDRKRKEDQRVKDLQQAYDSLSLLKQALLQERDLLTNNYVQIALGKFHHSDSNRPYLIMRRSGGGYLRYWYIHFGNYRGFILIEEGTGRERIPRDPEIGTQYENKEETLGHSVAEAAENIARLLGRGGIRGDDNWFIRPTERWKPSRWFW